jgi:uncharacterized protein
MSGKYDLTYFSPKVDKRKSAIDGRGLFAREDISAGEVLVVKGGYVLTRAQRDQVGTLLGPRKFRSPKTCSLARRHGGSGKAA